jgi:hypothetical protein
MTARPMKQEQCRINTTAYIYLHVVATVVYTEKIRTKTNCEIQNIKRNMFYKLKGHFYTYLIP